MHWSLKNKAPAYIMFTFISVGKERSKEIGIHKERKWCGFKKFLDKEGCFLMNC